MKRVPLKSSIALAWCLLLPVTASAAYTHTPGITDIVTHGGNSKTLVVQVLNLTEYDMELTGFSDTLHDETDRSRHTAKSFMFAPLGLPQTIPAVPEDPQSAKPYTAVLSWDDNDGYTVNNWLTYTLRGVDCTDKACTAAKEDVDVGIWITRSNPDKGLSAGTYYQLAKNVLREVFAIVGVVLFPEVPPVWINFTLATAGLTKEGFLAQQEAADVGHEWYLAAYPVPSPTSLCYNFPKNCYPSQAIADDAIEENWGPGDGGLTQSRIVVVTQVLRGKQPTKACNPDCNPYCTYGALGSVPAMLVTVVATDVWNPAVVAAIANCDQITPTPDYCPQSSGAVASGSKARRVPPRSAVANSGPMIRSILEQHGVEGRLALASVIRGLNSEQEQRLREMYQTWRAGESFTPPQQALLHLIAVNLRNAVK